MSALDLSQEGHAISKAIKTVVDNSPPGGSPTAASWVVLTVHNPLRNTFGASVGGNKPSVLKVQATGEGEMSELFEEFNDGRVQFAMVKVKDVNTQLGKNVFVAWCGEGVPEYVKGNYPSHLAHVQKNLFSGNNSYHVQINARSTDDLDAAAIAEKVANASGSKYASANVVSTLSKTKTAPPKPAAPAVGAKPAWKPGQAYTPTRTSGTHNPATGYGARGRTQGAQPVGNVDQDGWGEDAPQLSRNKLETVGSAYKPTKVNMKELMAGKSDTTSGGGFERPEPVRGAYEPVGKVDIAALRARGDKRFDHKPEVVKGAYEPVGKVDIAAIRAQAQQKEPASRPTPSAAHRGEEEEEEKPRSLADRSAAFNKPAEAARLTSLPKPKPAKAFGTPSTFTGTKPPTPGNFGPTPSTAPVGTASKDFASEGGKTPAQIWQEKKNRERGSVSEAAPPSPVSQQRQEPATATEEGPGVSALRDRFKGMPVSSMGQAPPPAPRQPSPPPAPALDTSSKPGAYHEEEQEKHYEQQRQPSPSPPSSPVRIAMPVARGQAPREPSPEPEPEHAPVPLPTRARSPSPPPAPAAAGGHGGHGGLTARILYDYEKAEDNEIDLVEGQTVSHIDQVDDDWWSGTNEAGETGLFPSNYVELVEGGAEAPAAMQHEPEPEPEPQHAHHEEPTAAAEEEGATAVAAYEYEAAEDNELSFPEGATITGVQFPDDDWWFGHYGGKEGLFPANYVELQQ